MAWILMGSLALGACAEPPKANKNDPPPPPNVQEVKLGLFVPEGSPLRQRLAVQTITSEPLRSELEAPAAVEAEPTRMAKIAPPLTGRVVKLFVNFGDAVKQGQRLFTLDSPDLVAAQSDYLKAKSAVAQAERNLARQKDLRDHAIGAERDLEQAQTDRDTTESELDRTQTRLQLLRVGPGGVGGPLTVVSPIAGRVIDLSTAPGQYQNDPAAILMIVADLSVVWLTANVQEKDIRRVHVGDDANAAFEAYPDEKFTGKVLFVGDLLDPDTRTIKVRVAFDNPDFRLKPGMFATVKFQGETEQALLVPAPAVVLGGERSRVYVEVAPWTFQKRDVEVGDQVGQRLVIKSGITSGTRIVTANAVLLP
ncbi:MAG TPA: efflux RND transporter periplasmic adaptor subunit [Polyangiaceae bacterium]|nr:efflux RND transporter periplasmic adaptor subunit [Polyangiaceae bacterium]